MAKKINKLQSYILSSVCIDKYILIPGRILIHVFILKNLTLKALIITIAATYFVTIFFILGTKKTA